MSSSRARRAPCTCAWPTARATSGAGGASGASSVRRAPDVDDVAHRDDAGRVAAGHDNEVTEAAAGHRVGALLQRPVELFEGRLPPEVVLDELAVGVLASPE